MSKHLAPCNKRSASNCCFRPRFQASFAKKPAPPPCTDLELDVDKEEFQIGQDLFVRYIFRVRNNGPIPAENAILKVTFFGGLISPTPGWSISDNIASFNLGDLPVGFDSGNTITLTFAAGTVVPPQEFLSIVFGTVTSDTPDCQPLNNIDVEEQNVIMVL